MKDTRALKRASTLLMLLCALTGLVFIYIVTRQQENNLGRPAIWSGYSLFAVFISLVLFNTRKRIAMLPQLGRAYWWHQLHLILGFATIPLYVLHVDSWWPEPGYERWLSGCFYLVILSGILGFLIQMRFPKRLAHTGCEIIFERVPDAIAEIKMAAVGLVDDSIRKTESETLLRLYQESLDAFFSKPRFVFSNLLGNQAEEYYLKSHCDAARQYCDGKELEILQQLEALAQKKISIDKHYAYQLTMKLWLFVHIPAVVGVSVLVLWHLLLVNIYAL